MNAASLSFPRRIVCLTEETTETLYLLGEQDRIVGVSGYTARPPEARQKPKVSAFISAKFDKILALEPDLVLGFSNLQAEIARELISRGITVLVFNQRSVGEIFDMIAMLGRIAGAGSRAETLATELRAGLDAIAAESQGQPRRPRVFFEEWHHPLISGIRWVEELIEIAGGECIFPALRHEHDARNRIVDPAAVVERDPEIIIASWCGRKVNPAWIRARPGWDRIAAVRQGRIHEVKSTIILQPGPAALTDGVKRLREIIRGGP